jgi:S-adenosyl methyltransferase
MLPEDWLRVTSRSVEATRMIDASVPSLVRVWNYLVGGRDNFEADRAAVRRLHAAIPLLPELGRAGRAFYGRVVSYLAGEAGIRQFIDVSLGMPTSGVTHEAAQGVAPASRVVYVTSDPVALSHARALISSSAEGAVGYVKADARDTAAIIAGVGETLDLDQPAAVVMIDILNFVEDPGGVIARLTAALPSGSYVAVMQVVRDERLALGARWWSNIVNIPIFLRDREEVARWLDGLELVGPGIVEVHQWRPAPGDRDYPAGMPLLGAVARKP